MELTVTSAPNKPEVAIVALPGDLDASNYLQVIQRVDELYKGGTRGLIFDLSTDRVCQQFRPRRDSQHGDAHAGAAAAEPRGRLGRDPGHEGRLGRQGA